MRVLVVVIVVIVVVTWESKANSSSSLTELQTGTELGNIEANIKPKIEANIEPYFEFNIEPNNELNFTSLKFTYSDRMCCCAQFFFVRIPFDPNISSTKIFLESNFFTFIVLGNIF